MKVKVLGVVNISYQNDIDIVKIFLNIDNIVLGPKFSISPSSSFQKRWVCQDTILLQLKSQFPMNKISDRL